MKESNNPIPRLVSLLLPAVVIIASCPYTRRIDLLPVLIFRLSRGW